jgi:hypothetical protein
VWECNLYATENMNSMADLLQWQLWHPCDASFIKRVYKERAVCVVEHCNSGNFKLGINTPYCHTFGRKLTSLGIVTCLCHKSLVV